MPSVKIVKFMKFVKVTLLYDPEMVYSNSVGEFGSVIMKKTRGRHIAAGTKKSAPREYRGREYG